MIGTVAQGHRPRIFLWRFLPGGQRATKWFRGRLAPESPIGWSTAMNFTKKVGIANKISRLFLLATIAFGWFGANSQAQQTADTAHDAAPPPAQAKNASSSANSYEIDVPATKQWVDSSIDLRAGEKIRITSSETITYPASKSSKSQDGQTVSPDGLPRGLPRSDSPVCGGEWRAWRFDRAAGVNRCRTAILGRRDEGISSARRGTIVSRNQPKPQRCLQRHGKLPCEDRRD